MRPLPLIALALYPVTVLASGGEILLLFWLEAALFVVAVMLSATVRPLPWTARLLLFLMYLATVLLTWFATGGMPYDANHVLINAVCVGIPAAVLFVGYFLALRRAKT
jgi:hypothetical protein